MLIGSVIENPPVPLLLNNNDVLVNRLTGLYWSFLLRLTSQNK